jgi:SAM-dependent methyltransferase
MLHKLSSLRIVTLCILALLLVWVVSFMIKEKDESMLTKESDQQLNMSAIIKRLTTSTNLTLPLAEELTLLDELSDFELGRSLLVNKALSGRWTSYIIVDAPSKDLKNPLEHWMVHDAPAVKATRERFYIFEDQIQKYTNQGMTLASIPCGTMNDLLLADLPQDVKFVGIDLDPESLELAKKNALARNRESASDFIQKNAWHLGTSSAYDIITSNGLNIYEPDDDKVVELYKQFAIALKPRGILITSFLTPPPALSKDSTWKNFNQPDLVKQKAIFADILQVKWQSFRTELQTRQQLDKAGFDVIDVIYDQQGMFPTIVARKR